MKNACGFCDQRLRLNKGCGFFFWGLFAEVLLVWEVTSNWGSSYVLALWWLIHIRYLCWGIRFFLKDQLLKFAYPTGFRLLKWTPKPESHNLSHSLVLLGEIWIPNPCSSFMLVNIFSKLRQQNGAWTKGRYHNCYLKLFPLGRQLGTGQLRRGRTESSKKCGEK